VRSYLEKNLHKIGLVERHKGVCSEFKLQYSKKKRSNLKWIKDLNTRPKFLKLVQERAGNTLELIGIGNDFLNRTQMAQPRRERIDKWDYMKLKSFFTIKETVSKLKRLPTEWEKIFASCTSDKRLTTRIYRVLKNLSIPKINETVRKRGNDLNRAFLKEQVQMAKKTT
jgi:hypothetical protein